MLLGVQVVDKKHSLPVEWQQFLKNLCMEVNLTVIKYSRVEIDFNHLYIYSCAFQPSWTMSKGLHTNQGFYYLIY